MATLYTKTGDDGTTCQTSGKRVAKDDIRIEVRGALDELGSAIGVVRAYPETPEATRKLLKRVQEELLHWEAIQAKQIKQLEREIDAFEAKLPPVKDFVLVGSNLAEASCHVARTVCRRAERSLVRLSKQEEVSPAILAYINRLSDWLFVVARGLAEE